MRKPRRPRPRAAEKPVPPWRGLEDAWPCVALSWEPVEAYALLRTFDGILPKGMPSDVRGPRCNPARFLMVETLLGAAEGEEAALGAFAERLPPEQLAGTGIAEEAIDLRGLAEKVEALSEHQCALLIGWVCGAFDGQRWAVGEAVR